MLNPKVQPKLKNRTNYFIEDKDRTHVQFTSPNTYQTRQMKIEGYETRLYWQWKYCDEHNGQTFFYTLTYNDKALPRHYKINCFDYEDLRDLLTGGMRKKLLRQYGTKFKYFVGAELGDGKGQRGLHNNPHYHILLFLEPANDKRYPYIKITEKEMTHLVKMYWQGFDERETGYKDYNEAKYGIADDDKDGLGATVKDFRADKYVAKYVCKDIKLIRNEKKVQRYLEWSMNKKYRNKEETYREFFKQVIWEMFNTPLNAKKTKWAFDELGLIQEIYPEAFQLMDIIGDTPKLNEDDYGYYVVGIIKKYKLWKKYYEFCTNYITPKIQEKINEYRNRYCNKCRISHQVGDYAIKFIKDKMNPTIQVPAKKGFKNRPISMYYYRKLYTNTVKDKLTGNNMYILNDLGIQYKMYKLPGQIEKKQQTAKNNLDHILNNEELYNKMRSSDINTNVKMTYPEFRRYMEKLLKDDTIQNITKHYAEYKLVYEDRFFKIHNDGNNQSTDFPKLNILADYNRFIIPSYYNVPRNDYLLTDFLENNHPGYLPYISHPDFLRFTGIFNLLDLCTNYFNIQKDDKDQREAEEIANVRRYHKQLKVKKYYSQFS